MTPEQERDYLLDHVRQPRNVGEIGDAQGMGECRNPACGDHVKVTLKNPDHIEIKIKAVGCTICVASASLMSELVKHKKSSDVQGLIFLMHESLKSGNAWPETLSLLSPLKRMRESPMKIPCTLTGWVALERALQSLP